MRRVSESGSVLIFSLWIMVFLSLVALGFHRHTRVDFKLAQYQWDQIRLVQIAKNGAKIFISEMLNRSRGPIYAPHLIEDLFTSVNEREQNGGTALIHSRTDEESRINMNSAPQSVLMRLFNNDSDLTHAVLDWRDSDDDERPGGGENEFYRSRPHPYSCRNGPLKSIEELLLVKGMTRDRYKQIYDKVTVYSKGPVNVNTASSEILTLLGLEPTLADKIILYRKGPDGSLMTADDLVFPSLQKIEPLLNQEFKINDEEAFSLRHLIRLGHMGVQSHVFRLEMKARMKDRKASKKIMLVIEPGAKKKPIRSWSEHS